MAEIQLSETETPANLKDQLDKLSTSTCTAGDRVTFLARTATDAIRDAQSCGVINDAQSDALMRAMISADMIADIGEEVSVLAERLELLSMEQPAGPINASNAHDDADLLAYWNEWQEAQGKCKAKAPVSPHDPNLREWTAVENKIQRHVAKTPSGVKVHLLLALSASAGKSKVGELADSGDLDALFAMEPHLDWEHALIVSALKSLHHMEAGHG